MKNTKKLLAFLLALVMILGLNPVVSASPASTFITTPATGYDSADDVVYKTYSQSGKTVVANWGARGETCVFLSDYAEDYYTGNYEWDTMSDLSGGTSQSNAPSSSLYNKLQDLMESTHTFYTYYDGNKNVRDYYKYTDCVRSDTSKVALLYRGGLVSSTWNGGNIWNQEHVWPQSKLYNSKQIGDIMHLRPSNPSENTSRSNTAYGASSGYDPGVSVRGDCATTVLYMYVRWGTTNTMWGSSGVIENLSTLLAWMEADPVDTWEMGRNDAVQSITGVRNVFVDYPEYAWLLFGEDVPSNMTTPSGEANGGVSGGGNSGNTGSGTVTPNPDTPADPMTDKEILDAAYALNDNQYLDGTYTLTGKITAIDDNGYPTFVIGNYTTQPMYCYKLTDSRFTVGATITVTGAIKNYKGLIEMMNCTLNSITLPSDETPPETTTPETNPPEIEPPVSDIPSNKDGFTELVGLITSGTYQGQARFDAIAQAMEIYNNLSGSDQAAVSVAYTRLKTAIVAGNEDAAKVNSDTQSARDTFLPGAVIGFTLLTFAGCSLLGKKFF